MFIILSLYQRYHNIIRHYKKWKSLHPDTWIEHSVNQSSLSDAIKAAASCFDHNGRKHPHQYRLQIQHLKQYEDSLLLHLNAIQNVQHFSQLIRIVENAKVKGIGELAIYDTAVRIGAYLNLFPDLIYLHAGARIGAQGILGKLDSDVLDKRALPEPFSLSDLTCYELEDILCIYKAIFNRRRK